ncbi:MAG: hypothetical protein WCL27_16495 [Betaproteobacteria bacterium]
MASNTIVAAQGLDDIAMITALQGSVGLISQQGAKPLPVQSFSKLKQGDSLLMEDSALLKLIYLKNGRQEIWRGSGKVEILENEGKGGGSSTPEINNLSMQVVKQIAKTPSISKISQNNGKLRSLGVENSIERVEASYRKMRMESVHGDLNPELYLLSALFEMREIEKVEQVLADLRFSRPSDQEARVVIALYQKAIKNLKEGSNK